MTTLNASSIFDWELMIFLLQVAIDVYISVYNGIPILNPSFKPIHLGNVVVRIQGSSEVSSCILDEIKHVLECGT